MTGDIGTIALAAIFGGVLGIVYLGLLWAAVRVLPSRRGTLMFAALGLARALLVMAALGGALILGVPPVGIATAVVAFVAARVVATRIADRDHPANPDVGATRCK